MRRTLAFVAPFVVGAFALAFVVIEISALSLALAKALLGCSLLYVVIKYGHNEIDHIRMWKANPTYGGLLVLGYALVVAAAFVGS